MSLLQALVGLHERQSSGAEASTPPDGFTRERISFALILGTNGIVIGMNDKRDPKGNKSVPKLINVPRLGTQRTSGIVPNFLWDKTAYTLGVSLTSTRVEREHEAFKTLHLEALAGSDDEGLVALRRFVENWTPDQFANLRYADEMMDTSLVFRLDGEHGYIHERPAARALLQVLAQNSKAEVSGSTAMCLITGHIGSIARLHPPIKGVNGAQSSGASLISFNKTAFSSYGKEDGSNSPIGEKAAANYAATLNRLLESGSRNKVQIGDASTVFWAETDAAEKLVSLFFSAPAVDEDDAEAKIKNDAKQTVPLRDMLQQIAHNLPLETSELKIKPDTRTYILGLSPNAARLSVRFWYENTIQDLAGKFLTYWQDLRLEPSPFKDDQLKLWRILIQTAPYREGSKPKAEDVPPQLAGEWTRAILTGGRFPRAMFSAIIGRLRTDRHISNERVAILKACLTRDYRLNIEKENVQMGLDLENTSTAYRLGRLFYVMEHLQEEGIGSVNASIRDKYYGAASTTPASIIPVLLRGSMNHLATLRKQPEKRGILIKLEKQLGEITDGLLPDMPKTLRIEDQGRFAIGYWHQKQQRYVKSQTASPDISDLDTTPVNEE